MEVSKEFIEAMNGVLNGERWTRESLPDNYIIYMSKGYLVEGSDGIEEDYYIDGSDLLATDWKKV